MIGYKNGVLTCTTLLLLKTSVVGVHLKLVKDIPKTSQNSDSICGSLFGISRSVRLHESLETSNIYGVCTLHRRSNVLLHRGRVGKPKNLITSHLGYKAPILC